MARRGLPPAAPARRRRFRPTVAAWMGLVAASALACGVVKYWPVALDRNRVAARHAGDAAWWAATARLSLEPALIPRRWRITPARGAFLESQGYDVARPHLYGWELPPTPRPIPEPEPTIRRELTAICRERAAYHAAMRRKWAIASWLAWLDVGPDAAIPPVGGWGFHWDARFPDP